ncbi:hypothetical protein QA600_00015 [Natronococcus sp. A-GB1]|nr:hypothetical protein [Natronococcus sp. A-GB1]MDG5757730.1 hypothetical protein [Natronococcus sp. A-GB1]
MAISSLVGLTFVFAFLTAASYVGTRLAMRDVTPRVTEPRVRARGATG